MMKRPAFVLLVTGLAASWIGCQSATEPAADPAPAEPASQAARAELGTDAAVEETQADPAAPIDADLVLVSLSVPNML
jgi:hypothetical protein